MATTPGGTPQMSPTPPPTTGTAPQSKQPWMPIVAGVLSIVAGAGNVFIGLAALLVSTAWIETMIAPDVFRREFRAEAFLVLGIIWIILAIVAIIGGIASLRRKNWGLALAGSICALPWPMTVLGIVSIVFVALSQKDFK